MYISNLDELHLRQMSEDVPKLSDSVYQALKSLVKELIGNSSDQKQTVLSILTSLTNGELLTPLYGGEDEWSYDETTGLYINRRHPFVFKDKNNNSWFARGNVFFEKYLDKETGVETRVCFLSEESSVPISFPCIPKTNFVEVEPGSYVEGGKLVS